MKEVKLDSSFVFLGDDVMEQADEGEMKSALLRVGDTMKPDEVKVPKAPYVWVEPPPKTAKGEPTFDKVYNPGGWSSFSYRPVFMYVLQGVQ